MAETTAGPGLVAWFDQVDEDDTYLSVITLGEVRRGVDRLPPSRRRTELERWQEDLRLRFEGRVLTVDEEVAGRWGHMRARADQIGRTLGAVDALLAATAEYHQLEIVTRNVADFTASGVPVHNPWTD